MTKKMRLLLLLSLIALLLVACGGSGNSGNEMNNTENNTGNTTENSADAMNEGDNAAPTEEPAAEEPAAEEPAAEGDCSSEEFFCVGLVTDVGEIDDKSFNQSAWEGVQRAEAELGAQVDFIETQDAKDYATNIGLFADNGYDVIVTVGFALGTATLEAAAKYPEIGRASCRERV